MVDRWVTACWHAHTQTHTARSLDNTRCDLEKTGDLISVGLFFFPLPLKRKKKCRNRSSSQTGFQKEAEEKRSKFAKLTQALLDFARECLIITRRNCYVSSCHAS